jgi:hypothetical protein
LYYGQLCTVPRVHESNEYSESEDLPDGLRGFDGGDKGDQDGVPEPLAEEKDEGEHDQHGSEGDDGGASAHVSTGVSLECFGPGNDSIQAVSNSTTEHFYDGPRIYLDPCEEPSPGTRRRSCFCTVVLC